MPSANSDQARLKELLAAALTSAGPVTETLTGGSRVRVERSADAHVSFDRWDAGGVLTSSGVVHQPTTQRPDTLPADLPFFPGHESSLVEEHGRAVRMLLWTGLDDADARFDEVLAQSVADGWLESANGAVDNPAMKQRELHRGDRQRTIVLFAFGQPRTLSITEMPRRSERVSSAAT